MSPIGLVMRVMAFVVMVCEMVGFAGDYAQHRAVSFLLFDIGVFLGALFVYIRSRSA